MSDKADTLVKCAVEMMKNLSIGIKASGIDSAELEEYAVKIGVDKVQGFQLARFQSGAELIGFIKGRREKHAGLLL
jgi:EAL domain-containing protein (putative c-di-GMP-specific phosphodiesterase class I)